MPELEKYLDRIDIDRIRWARELSEVKRVFSSPPGSDAELVCSQAAVVLCYAAWEGFYNECIDAYISFLRERGGKVRETDRMLLLGAVGADLDSLRDRNHSDEARFDFVANLRARLECGFDKVDESHLKSHSNLNWKRLGYSYSILSFDLLSLQEYRLRLDRELVGWRHSVAHGEMPNLSNLDIANHVDFTSEILVTLADDFQYGISQRIE